MPYASAGKLIPERVVCLVKPTARPSVSEFVTKHRKLSRDDTREHGNYSWKRAPYQKEMMDIINRKGRRRFVAMLSSQMGKTLTQMNILMYLIAVRPCTILFMVPSIKDAKKFSRLRIRPFIRDNPLMSSLIGSSSADGNTLTEKHFPGGNLLLVGSNVASDLAAVSGNAAFVDEFDRCAREAVNSAGEKEGDPLMLLWKRLANDPSAFVYVSGTPTIRGASPTEDLWNRSTKMLYMIPCPVCKDLQFLDKSRLKYEEKDLSDIHFSCIKPSCSGKLTRSVMQKSYFEGSSEWVETGEKDAELAGFHLNQFYSPWRSWTEIVREIDEAKGVPSKEKVIQNTVWGLTYELASVRVPEWARLHALKEDFPPGLVPAAASVLTAFTDVQEDRFETTIMAWNRNQAWVIDHIITAGCSVWDLDDEMYDLYEKTILEASWPHESGYRLKPRRVFIDSGFFTSRILKFCQKHRNRLIPTRGEDRLESTFSAPKNTSISSRGRWLKHGVKRWNLGVSQIKIDLYARLNLLTEGEKDNGLRIHFHKKLPEEYFRQLTAETCYVDSGQFGRPKYRWIKDKYFANEALDCAVGNLAAFEIEGYNRWSEEHWQQEAAKFQAPEVREEKREREGKRRTSAGSMI
ncbi:MAG: phage terminase large subunit family protein [Deltaproteobacteria bacterium]|nr:phage terminase large subunit family protein [Deltaproteobacteria bacterium]